MKFLMRFWKIFGELFSKRRDEGELPADMPITRYMFSRNDFSTKYDRVKPRAFLPDPRGELSIFQILDLSPAEIWEIGHQIRPDRNLHARADFRISDVNEIAAEEENAKNIALEIDDNPKRHGTIKGWPEEKPAQKLVAAEFASRSTLQLEDNPD